MAKVMAVGVAWISREDWDGMRALCPDLQDNYDEWLAKAGKALAQAEAQGIKIVKAPMTAASLAEYCQREGVEPNSRARAAFASFLAFKQVGMN